MKKLKHKKITIDDAVNALLKAKEKYGNLPLTMKTDESSSFDIEEQKEWYIRDIIISKHNVTFYNY